MYNQVYCEALIIYSYKVKLTFLVAHVNVLPDFFFLQSCLTNNVQFAAFHKLAENKVCQNVLEFTVCGTGGFCHFFVKALLHKVDNSHSLVLTHLCKNHHCTSSECITIKCKKNNENKQPK